MASADATRILRTDADERVRITATALADHFGIDPPVMDRRTNRDIALRDARNQEQIANFLEALADAEGVEMNRRPRGGVPVAGDPTRTEALILTDDPEENKRREKQLKDRQRAYRIARGEEKIETPDRPAPVQSNAGEPTEPYVPGSEARDFGVGDPNKELTPSRGLPEPTKESKKAARSGKNEGEDSGEPETASNTAPASPPAESERTGKGGAQHSGSPVPPSSTKQ